MHPLYEASIATTEELKEARLRVVRLSTELSQAEHDLCLLRARVERGLIRKVGGEKALAPTVEDRARIFTLALAADPEYEAARKRRDEIALELEQVKVEVAALRDRLDVMLAAMGAVEGG
jgi:hypothetical protein